MFNSSKNYTRREFVSKGFKIGTAAFTSSIIPKLKLKAEGKYNVVFIIVDDLRPMLGCYGIPQMHTPNIDRLANRGTLFNRAYCQYPLCNPSRASILTGLRPQTTNVYNNTADYRETIPEATDIYQHFSVNGYSIHTVGKVRHHPAPFQFGPVWNALDVADDKLSDGITANEAVNLLEKIKNQQFLLTIGLDKPHLPLHAPKKYFDLYDLNTFDLPSTSDYPENAPAIAHNNLRFFRLYRDIPSDPNAPISDEKSIEIIRAYAASTSYMDAQVGHIMNKLDSLGLNQNTIIAFCGDHGFHLGEHGTWRKNTLYEVSTRSPLIISIPDQKPCQTNSLSELVDIFPTLCDACDIPIPENLEGNSLLPIIKEPTLTGKYAAFSFLSRSGVKTNSIRTDRYRYTEWGKRAKFGHELYDYLTDPNESTNVVDYPENANLVKDLQRQLNAGWQSAFSESTIQNTEIQTLPWDINNDGHVDLMDLEIISNSFDSINPEFPKVDVNRDGKIDMIDLLLVASHLGECSNISAPSKELQISYEDNEIIFDWLQKAYEIQDSSETLQKGINNLEKLINTKFPVKSTLLQNYPNPFNPETWIPYDLAQDAYVRIQIFDQKGKTIRELNIGFQDAGAYRTNHKAAYWDGRNSLGELVSSGMYYYSLNTGNKKHIRKMLIRK
ncbi:sulfatase-like hydrolase/transferase [Candidatus Poribacteria bacterium]|nr:sulfatase-like hydrolase/transferase [Candidatus Poribacteria bacterium]